MLACVPAFVEVMHAFSLSLKTHRHINTHSHGLTAPLWVRNIMIFPPLLSIKNSIPTPNRSPVASSDSLLHLDEPWEFSSALTCGQWWGGGSPFSDPSSVANSSMILIESDSFLFLLTIQPAVLFLLGWGLFAMQVVNQVYCKTGSICQCSLEKAP